MKATFLQLLIFFTVFISGCSNNTGNKVDSSDKNKQQVKVKPPSSFPDTLLIQNKSAVFYFPDSIQLEKIQMNTDKSVFESNEHEFFYQIRNAKGVIKQNTPSLNVVDAKKVRFIRFTKDNDTSIVIDLDSKMDSHGLFLFDGKQDPKQVDMMNIDTELWVYFKTSN